jgi:hypothetical protein
MPVRIAAVLDLATVTGLLRELTPFTVNLDEDGSGDRWMRVDPPESVALVAGMGLRIKTSAHLQWTVAGVKIPVTIRTVTIALGLELTDTKKGIRLCALPRIEDADLKNVPEMIDDKIVDVVNARLAAKAGEIGWTFGDTLTLRLQLPTALASVDAFRMDVSDASLEVGAEAVRLDANLPMHFSRVAAT